MNAAPEWSQCSKDVKKVRRPQDGEPALRLWSRQTPVRGIRAILWSVELLLAAAFVCPAQVTFSAYSVPNSVTPALSEGITTGPDNNLWFLDGHGVKIWKMNPAGAIIGEFTIPSNGKFNNGSGASFIATGPDGNLWFPEYFTINVGRITSAGVIKEFPINGDYAFPLGITAGPDGNLWFTEYVGNKIGSITPDGAVTEFSVPSGGTNGAWGITAGPDGNLWFTECRCSGAGSGPTNIGKITPTGTVTEFPVPTANSAPSQITAGPDGNLWFTEQGANKIARITTAGMVTEYTIPTAGSLPFGITAAPDGNLWFTETGANKIGRITADGMITEFLVTAGQGAPAGITTGPDGNLWITDGNTIVKATIPTTQLTISPSTGGNAGNVTARIFGNGFQTGANVKLTGSGPDIFGTNTAIANSSFITTTFDLRGATVGARTLTITNADNSSALLPNGFTIEQGGQPSISVDLIGRSQIRIGREQEYYAVFGNSGMVDSPDAVLVDITSIDGTTKGVSPSATTGIQSFKPSASASAAAGSVIASLAVIGVPAGSTISIPILLRKQGLSCDQLDIAKTNKKPQDMDCDELEDLISRVGYVYLLNKNISGLSDRQNQWAAPLRYACELHIQKCAGRGCPYYCQQLTNPPCGPGAPVSAAVAHSHNGSISALSASPPSTPYASLTLCGVSSIDPNDKIGPTGTGAPRFTAGAQPLNYSIYFDNQPTANASAQTVDVTDTLDKNLVDLNTLTLGPLSFVGKFSTPAPNPLALSPYSTDIDLRPGTNLIVRIGASLSTTTGILKWTFASIDPATNQPTTDPLAGFLPPGQEGSVSFTVAPKSPPTGTQITNKATIVFDVNLPMDTPVWLNTIDNTAPTSKVSPLASTQTSPSFTVQWSGSDVGSGIQDFAVYVSDNGSPFTAWLTQTTGTSATYSGQTSHTYNFYSIARDLVGNIEPAKATAEATTTIQLPACAFDATNQFKITRSGFRLNNATGHYLQTVSLQQLTLTPIQLPVSLVLDSLSPNAMLFNKSGVTSCAAPSGAPYINVDGTTVTLEFTNPTNAGITYNTRVLEGGASR